MTPQQFERACYELGLHELPQELQDAWRDVAIAGLRQINSMSRFGFDESIGFDYCIQNVKLCADSAMRHLTSHPKTTQRNIGECVEYLVHAIAADKRNRNADNNQ